MQRQNRAKGESAWWEGATRGTQNGICNRRWQGAFARFPIAATGSDPLGVAEAAQYSKAGGRWPGRHGRDPGRHCDVEGVAVG